MDDEKLILLVQANDIIYNKRNPNYKLADKKKMAWIEVGKQMGMPAEICSKRWTSLRDRYVREKRVQNLPSGSGANFKYRWPLMDAMQFLDPFIASRPMRSSTNIVNEFSSTSSSLSLQISSSSSESQSPLPSPAAPSQNTYYYTLSPDEIIQMDSPSIETQLIETEPFEPTLIETPPNSSISKENLPKKRKKNVDPGEVDALFAEAVVSFKKYCENDENAKTEQNETLNGFGKMILSIISKMSDAKQVKAIQKVTALVMEIKMEPEE